MMNDSLHDGDALRDIITTIVTIVIKLCSPFACGIFEVLNLSPFRLVFFLLGPLVSSVALRHDKLIKGSP